MTTFLMLSGVIGLAWCAAMVCTITVWAFG